MQPPVHATRQTPLGASRFSQAMSAWSVQTRRAPSRYYNDTRVNGHRTPAKQLSCKMEAHVDTLAPSRSKRVLDQRYPLSPLWLSLNTRTNDPSGSGQINDNTAPVNKAFFTPPPRATCSGTAVDSATHLTQRPIRPAQGRTHPG